VCDDGEMRAPTGRQHRVRLDELLVERGIASSRTRAAAYLLGGRVRVGDGDAARGDRKPGDLVDPVVAIALIERDPYVSRGGHKLAAALEAFSIDPRGLVCLDVGASTGGFTDVLLQRGASRVYALDVGRGQLAEPLRADPRVVSMERTNARTLGPGVLPEAVDLAVIDVSFISLGLILARVAACLQPTHAGHLVPLVKPQFEVGKGGTDGGVVRDPVLHRQVLERVVALANGLGLEPIDLVASPILGPQGNREFLLDLLVPVGWRAGAAPDRPSEPGRSAGPAPELLARIAAVTGG